MKNITRIICVVLLIATGFAAGFPIGSITGFSRGSEWALYQADILARESGLFMPVCFDGGDFRVIMKQPKGLYRRASASADQKDSNSIRRTVQAKTSDADQLLYAVQAQADPAPLTAVQQ